MDYKDRIECKPDVLLGKPVIKGTRVSVELILERLSQGASVPDLLEAYPHITQNDILAALSYASAALSKEELLAI
jgi:uncharacterized protein (DUF433 family)